MKSALVTLALVIGFSLTNPSASFAAAPAVRDCEVLTQSIAKQGAKIAKLKRKGKAIAGIDRKRFTATKAKHKRICQVPVCGDVQAAECAAAGADVCITMIKEKTFESVLALKQAGATLLHAGACLNERPSDFGIGK